MTDPTEAQIVPLFATPIFRATCPDWQQVNLNLRRLILEHEKNDPGERHSNVGGWHSKPDLLMWSAAEIATLKSWMVHAVKAMTKATSGASGEVSGKLELHAWANVSRRGAYNKIHSHPGHGWSGTYYVDLGHNDPGASDSGLIEFIDPRVGADMVEIPGAPFGRKYRITPEPGMLLLFPAWLQHYVNPFAGDGERISIAFNVNILSSEISKASAG